MAFFSPSFSAISQPKMRQEGFHLPSPSPSSGNPPSPSSAGPFDLFLSHSSHHAHAGGTANGPNGSAHSASVNGSGGGAGFPSLALPDAFSRTSAMDLTDELAMSLMASSSSPATSNERSTHTPPFDGLPHHHPHHPQHQHQHQHDAYRPPSTHNIFDISAPPSTHFAHLGGHAFSLPHTSARPDLPPLSQPASLATSGLHGFEHHHHQQQQQQQHNQHNQQQHNQSMAHHAFLGGRDPFPAHFNSTIPPLSAHHEPPTPLMSAHTPDGLHQPFSPFSPTSSGSGPPRDTPSPAGTGAGAARAGSRPATGHSARSVSRSRSRVRTGGSSQASVPPSAGGGPTRTTKSTSRRRDSFTMPHLAHAHSHSHSHSAHLHGLPSPPSRPQAIVIPAHGGPGGALSPLSGMGGLGSALSPLGVGQASGWFLPGANSGAGGANPGSAPGAEFSLPTPESVHGAGAFGQFGTSVGSMGISPKETTLGSKGDGSPPLDAASKQAAIVNEKRRRRRESHNAVERRRRDNINEKISELATLIPEVMLDPTAPASSSGVPNGPEDALLPGDASSKNAKDGAKDGSEDGGTPGADGAGSANGSKDAGGVKANKGMILRKSVEYIRYLQQLVGAQAARNRALEAQLARAGLSSGPNGAGGAGSVRVNGGSGSDADGESDRRHLGADTHAFGDDVLDLHAFEMDVGVGLNGFGALEPMAEGSEMDMEMEMEMDGGEYGEYTRRAHTHTHTHGLTNGHVNGRSHELTNGNGHTKARRVRTSPSASAASEEAENENEDGEDGGSSSGGGGGSAGNGALSGEEASEAEEQQRGRRGRDGRVPRGPAGGLVAVKEESALMDV
ncbi:hypothetical protein M0805_004885 [Coniferiporia weirii]|nr:hypothetical protein M0805_004885 [Coniferiporia weirii]